MLDSDSFAMFRVQGAEWIEGRQVLAGLNMSPEFQETFNQAKGSIPARVDVPLDDFDSCAQRSQADLTVRALKSFAVDTASGLFAEAPLNTDDRPRIEYLAPAPTAPSSAAPPPVTGRERDALFADLPDALPPQADPHLARLTPPRPAPPTAPPTTTAAAPPPAATPPLRSRVVLRQEPGQGHRGKA